MRSEAGLDVLPIQLSQIGERLAALGVPALLIGEQVVCPDAAVSAVHCVLDLVLLQQGDEERARQVQEIRRLLDGEQTLRLGHVRCGCGGVQLFPVS
jgi:hypothetical protein